MSAQHAVRAIFGSKDTYEYLPFFYSREFTLSWQFYGVNEGECVLFGSMDEGKFGAYWVKDDKVGHGTQQQGCPIHCWGEGCNPAGIQPMSDVRWVPGQPG